MILFALILMGTLTGCSNRHKLFDLETTLGDNLTFEIKLSGNLHGMYPTYRINSNDLEGLIYFKDYSNESGKLPINPRRSFQEVGRYGDTNIYEFLNGDVIIWVNGNKYLG